jgi:hypothetical protein
MSVTFENAVAAIGLLGVGGILGNYFQILWQRRSADLSKKQEFKETRYKCIILLMYSALDFDRQKEHLVQHGRNFRTRGELLEELQTEWHNMILFASDDALKAVHSFIQSPAAARFKSAALAMRADLWGGKISTDLEHLDFEVTKHEAKR